MSNVPDSNPAIAVAEDPKVAEVPGDPAIFRALMEISITAALANRMLGRHLPDGLTEAQFGVLNHLIRHDRSETPSRLAAAFRVSRPTMTSTIGRLCAKGLVSVAPDPDDARGKCVTVTPAGRDLRARALAALAPYFRELESVISASKAEALLPDLRRIRLFFDNHR